MDTEPRTRHYGLVARWWAELNVSGPEIDYFRQFLEGDGQPALDVACGTGRLLVPYLQAGLDVDGCDISEDMLALCRERAEHEGLAPNLYPRAVRYSTPRPGPPAPVVNSPRGRGARRPCRVGKSTPRSDAGTR